jgi:uncharacterized membrane protein YiaA
MNNKNLEALKPTQAYLGVTWAAFAFSVIVFGIGLFNAEMLLSEKGFYILALVFGLYSVITLQKTIRDQSEGVEVDSIYLILSYVGVAVPLLSMCIGLFNAELQLNEKGFFAVTYIMTLFSSLVLQKNTRDTAFFNETPVPNVFKSKAEKD